MLLHWNGLKESQTLTGSVPWRPDKPRTHDEKHHPDRQKEQVEPELLWMPRENVMNPENVMVNNAFDEIKETGPRQDGAKQNPPLPLWTGVSRGAK